MPLLLTALGPLQLAVIIGLVELVISESLYIVTVYFLSWVRRYGMFKNIKYVLRPTWLNGLSGVFITQLIQLMLCIWLELSISPARFPSSKLIQERCFKTERPTLALSRRGATKNSLLDVRVGTYVSQASCEGGLYNETLAGETALIRGYPKCRKDWKIRNVTEALSLQGSNEAYIANSKNGDPHLAYGLASGNGSIIAEDHGDEDSNQLATRSFWTLLFGSDRGSYASWNFEFTDERVLTNIAIPWSLIDRAPRKANFTDAQIGSIACLKDDLECYHQYAAVAKNLDVINDSLAENSTAVFIRSHQTYPSSICIFDKNMVEINVSWVFMKQSIPYAERNRSGPAITQLSIAGNNGQCLDDITQTTSRLYIDALKRNGFRSLLLTEETLNPKHDNLQRTISTMQKAAVITGMNTPNTEAGTHDCFICASHNGSSIGIIETAVSSVYLFCIVCVIVFEIIVIFVYHNRCPRSIDPLESTEMLEQILLWQNGLSNQRSALSTRSNSEGDEVLPSHHNNDSYSIEIFNTENGYQFWVEKNNKKPKAEKQ